MSSMTHFVDRLEKALREPGRKGHVKHMNALQDRGFNILDLRPLVHRGTEAIPTTASGCITYLTTGSPKLRYIFRHIRD
jgi:hypothetical protein